MNQSYFVYNGIKSSDYGIIINAVSRYTVPERDYTVTDVPGRNGSIYTDMGRRKNVDITYHCYVASNKFLGFGDASEAFRRAMAECKGYCELYDSYNENEIRQAVLATSITPQNSGAGWVIGEFDVTFNCKPQIWLRNSAFDTTVYPIGKGSVNSSGNRTTGTGAVTGLIPIDGGANVSIRNSGTASVKTKVYQYKEDKTLVTSTEYTIAAGGASAYKLNTLTEYIRILWADGLTGSKVSVTVNGRALFKLDKDEYVINNTSGGTAKPKMIVRRTSASMTASRCFYVWRYEDNYNLCVTVKPFSGSMVIDCETMEAYSKETGENMNKYLYIGDYSDGSGYAAYEFPEFAPGETYIRTNNFGENTTEPCFEIDVEGYGVVF